MPGETEVETVPPAGNPEGDTFDNLDEIAAPSHDQGSTDANVEAPRGGGGGDSGGSDSSKCVTKYLEDHCKVRALYYWRACTLIMNYASYSFSKKYVIVCPPQLSYVS